MQNNLIRKTSLVLIFVMLIGILQSFPILGYTNSNVVDAESTGIESFGVNSDGYLEINGEVLYMLVDGKRVKATLTGLFENGEENQELVVKDDIEDKSLLSSITSFLLPTKVKAAAPKIEYKGAVTYAGNTVGNFRVDGVQAFCFQHSKKSPPTGTKYNEATPFDNAKVQRALYYGWGGAENIFSNEAEGLVTTSLILDRIYSGGSSGKSLPKYDKLWDLVNNGKNLDNGISFSDTDLSVSVKGNIQVSQTTKLNTSENNSVKIKVPSGVTIVNESTGKKVTNGTMTVKGGEKVHLEAGLDKGLSYNTGKITSTEKLYQPLITKPQGGSFQVLGFIKVYDDPNNTASFKAKFEVREKNIDVTWKDKDSSKVFKHVNEDKPINSKYKYTPNKTFTDGDKVYERMTDKPFEGTVTKDVKHVFEYKLRRTVTVNYYDNRTGEKVKDTKTYTKLRGDKYSESHPTIKQDGYTMRYVKKTGDAESGTIGTKNLTINYYYDKPLAKLELEKVQVYTAKASEGMPVRVYLSKELNYKSSIADMGNKKVSVGLYKGDALVEKKTYTAKSLPEQFDFKIPTSKLKVNEKANYTVKFEDYDKNDFDIKKGYESLSLDGWSANEGTKKLNLEDKQELTGRFVVMTEITPTTSMKKFVETITVTASPLEDEKSGYGHETDLKITYSNDLGKDYQFATKVEANNSANFKADERLLEDTLDYEVKDGMLNFDLDKSKKDSSTNSLISWVDTFSFPHMNVEKKTGKLFTDAQVEGGISEIQNELRDGGNKFYSPVWADVTDYNLSYETNKVGANKLTYQLSDNWNIYAQMMGTIDSETIDDDEIVFIPVNPENPFQSGRPDNWTDEDIAWLNY